MSKPAFGLRTTQVWLAQDAIKCLIDSLQKEERTIVVYGGDETNYATELVIHVEERKDG